MNDGELKVLHVIPAVATRYGGPSRAIFEMCRPLNEHGGRLLIATTDADGDGHLPVPLGREIDYNGIPVIFFPHQWSEAYKYSRPLAHWLDKNVVNFDVVHIHAVFSHACLAAARACRRDGVPYIVRPLGTLDPWGMRQKPIRKRIFMRLGVDTMLRGAAAIHYTASGEKTAVEGTLGYGRGVVIPLGIKRVMDIETQSVDEAGAIKPSSLLCNRSVLFLSRLHHKKGLELLLETFIPLVASKELADWRLVVAGDGDPSYVARLKQKVRELKGEECVVFTGWLDGEAKSRALREAALLVLPSHQENFGVCLVEAMACGVPVIISPQVNLAPDVAEAGAGWIANLDISSLGVALQESMLNMDERQKRGAAARQLSKRFSSLETSRQLLDLYRDVTGRRQKAMTVPGS